MRDSAGRRGSRHHYSPALAARQWQSLIAVRESAHCLTCVGGQVDGRGAKSACTRVGTICSPNVFVFGRSRLEKSRRTLRVLRCRLSTESCCSSGCRVHLLHTRLNAHRSAVGVAAPRRHPGPWGGCGRCSGDLAERAERAERRAVRSSRRAVLQASRPRRRIRWVQHRGAAAYFCTLPPPPLPSAAILAVPVAE